MSKRITVAAAAAALTAAATVAMGAASASATAQAGSWSIDAPSTTATTTAAVHQAQIQQPINADNSSVWPAKRGVIPVQFKVTKATQTTTTTVYKFESLAGATDHTAWSWIGFVPSSNLTVGELTGLTATFTWEQGHNQVGGFRWQIGTADGNIMIDYGDVATSLQTGTDGSGIDMTTTNDNRVEASQLGHSSPFYDTWPNVSTLFADKLVTYVALVVDGGWGPDGSQVLDMQSLSVNGNVDTSPLTPAPVITSTTPVQTNSDPATLHLVRTAGSAPGSIDESQVTSTQGDTGGNFRQVDGKYIYNLDVSSLGVGTYQAFIQFAGTDVTTAPGVFGLK